MITRRRCGRLVWAPLVGTRAERRAAERRRRDAVEAASRFFRRVSARPVRSVAWYPIFYLAYGNLHFLLFHAAQECQARWWLADPLISPEEMERSIEWGRERYRAAAEWGAAL